MGLKGGGDNWKADTWVDMDIVQAVLKLNGLSTTQHNHVSSQLLPAYAIEGRFSGRSDR